MRDVYLDSNMDSYPEMNDCTKCSAYIASIGMVVDQSEARYGKLTLLSTHACSALLLGEGNTTSCCLYDENTDQYCDL